jgi:hypothetical protein
VLIHSRYTYDVHLENCTEAEPDEKREAEVNDSNIMPLTHLWILAGRFLMPDLQSNVVAALNYVLVTCKLEDEGLDRLVEFVNFIYEHLPAEANPLKQLALRRFFGQGVRGDMKAWQGRLPKDFLSESISWMEVNKPVEVKESRGPVEFNVAIRFVDKIKVSSKNSFRLF